MVGGISPSRLQANTQVCSLNPHPHNQHVQPDDELKRERKSTGGCGELRIPDGRAARGGAKSILEQVKVRNILFVFDVSVKTQKYLSLKSVNIQMTLYILKVACFYDNDSTLISLKKMEKKRHSENSRNGT